VLFRSVLTPPDESPEEEECDVDRRAGLLGQVGISTSQLGFSGMARIADQRVDVVTEGECIPAGVAVKVVEIDGNRVVVKRV